MKVYTGRTGVLPFILKNEWRNSHPCCFTHRTGGGVGPRAGLNFLEKKISLVLGQIRTPGRLPTGPITKQTALSPFHLKLIISDMGQKTGWDILTAV